MLRHTLFIGLNDKDTKKQIVATDRAKELIIKECGDCTISDALGVYTHDNGETVREKCLRVELLFKADNEVMDICRTLKVLLNQESIALEKSEINSMLV